MNKLYDIYLSGPMTGHDISYFERKHKTLNAMGFIVFSPHTIDQDLDWTSQIIECLRALSVSRVLLKIYPPNHKNTGINYGVLIEEIFCKKHGIPVLSEPITYNIIADVMNLTNKNPDMRAII